MKDTMRDDIIDLVHRRLCKHTLTLAEERKLTAWINESPENRELYAELADNAQLERAIAEFGEPDTEASFVKAKKRLSLNGVPQVTRKSIWHRFCDFFVNLFLKTTTK